MRTGRSFQPLTGIDPAPGSVVCQPALTISPVADLFAAADSSRDARQRLLALADTTRGASMAGGIHHYWRSLPSGSVKNWARIVGRAVFRSQAGSLGTGVGGAYGFPVQTEIATQVGACTCTEGDGTWGGELRARGRPMNRGSIRGVSTGTACTGMQATHRDYWRQRSPSTVSWALNPGCMTDATLAIDSLRYFA